jgi:RNA polymerase sigma-70 factor (ECF subfamily)
LRHSPADPAAWEEFVAHYGPRILAWCRTWGLQDADAQDVTQTVLLKLVEKLREFEYDPSRSFRAWLKTVTHHVWRDHVERQRRPGRGSGESSAFDRVEAGQALADCLEEAYEQDLLREAMARVQVRVERRTWEAFRLLAVENWSGADAARHLGMKVATVYVARSKVQRMLRDEIARLSDD